MRNGSRVPMLPQAASSPARALGALEFGAARMWAEIRRVVKDPSKVEAIHRARVASRRFIAAGDLWAAQVDGWGTLSERVSRLIRKLGRVRNLDVSLSLLRIGPRADRKAREELVSILKRRRKKELSRLGSWLTLRRVERLESRYRKQKSAVGSAPASDPPGPPSLRPYFERLARLAELIGSQADIEAGHEARRELRRLRYAHEMLTTEYEPSQFSADTERFRSVQQVAGAWHDLCILEELAIKTEHKGKASTSLRPLLDRVRGEAKTKLDEFISALAELEGLRPRLTSEGAE